MAKEHCGFDTECIGEGENVTFLFRAFNIERGLWVELWGDEPDDVLMIQRLFNNPDFTWVSFNGIKYDMVVTAAVLAGMPLSRVKEISNEIITENKPAWMSYRDYGIEQPDVDHIDISEVAPGVYVSLKLYGARMGMKTIRDLPYDHNKVLTPDEEIETSDYCVNDVETTVALFKKLEEPLALREVMGERFGLDLRSKSDAQMAEAIYIKELGLRGRTVDVPRSVRYTAPGFVQPRSQILRDILARCEQHEFKINRANGAVELPPFLAETPVIIGSGSYQMGVGGLHSTHDRSVFYMAKADFIIEDADAGSFYPNIIVNAGFSPKGLDGLIPLYVKILNERLEAKAKKQKAIDKTLKIFLNGTFGKLGSMFSKIYAPDLLIGVTLTGQFYLLTLIHLLATRTGVKVLSANTDGITYGGTPKQVAEARKLIQLYGELTNFEFEFVRYSKLAMKDVNNYIAVKVSEEKNPKLEDIVKAKGLYALSGLMKNPTNEVCTLAAQNYLAFGTPIEGFIRKHLSVENFKDFTQSRSVKGGGVQGDVFLGRVVRWYYSTDKNLSLNYKSNGNKVAKSGGGRAVQTLPDTIPADLDIDAYVKETETHLANMGVL